MPRRSDRARAMPAAGRVGECPVEHLDEHSRAANGRAGTAPGADEANQRLVRCIRIVASLLAEISEHRFLEETCPVPINRAQLRLLRLVTRVPGLQVGEVADHLGFSPAAACKNIDRLERLGLLVRNPVPDDRRAKRLLPTASGSRLVNEQARQEAERLAPVLDSIRPARLEQLCQALTEVVTGMAVQVPARYGTCLRCAGQVATDCPLRRLQGGCFLLDALHVAGPGQGGTA